MLNIPIDVSLLPRALVVWQKDGARGAFRCEVDLSVAASLVCSVNQEQGEGESKIVHWNVRILTGSALFSPAYQLAGGEAETIFDAQNLCERLVSLFLPWAKKTLIL